MTVDLPAQPSAALPRAFRIPADVDFETGFRKTVMEPATDAVRLLERYELDPAKAIHETRKDLKKLRAAVRLLRHHGGEEFHASEGVRLRDAGRLLASARDAEVKLGTLASLRLREVLPVDGAVLDQWAAALERDRDELIHRLDDPTVAVGSSGAAVRSMEAVIDECQGVAAWPVNGLRIESVLAAVARERARGITAMERVAAGGDDEAVHDFRKRIKDLWHHLDLLCDVLPAVADEHVLAAHDISDLLGDHNDLAVLVEDARSRPDIVNATDLVAIDEAVRVLERDLREQALTQARALYLRLS